MKANISLCYHPTTIVFVDDNCAFLESLKSDLITNNNHSYFSNPFQALSFITEKNFRPYVTRFALSNNDDDSLTSKVKIQFDVSKIVEEVYQKERFEQLSVIVVDFDMPKMNGAELVKKIFEKHQNKPQPYKIIMLTGEASDNTALQLFNDKKIDAFIRKDETDLLKKLASKVKELQHNYFCEQSTFLIEAVKANNDNVKVPLFLADQKFINFFNNYITVNHISEYYLIDNRGYMLLSDHGEVSWLIIQDEDDLEAGDDMCREGQGELAEFMTEGLAKAIERRELLIFYPNQSFEIKNEYDWHRVLYPANKISCENTYYYSHIKHAQTHFEINMDQVLSYRTYCQHQKFSMPE